MKTPDQLQTASDFLEFFEAIPEEKWCVFKFTQVDGRCCAAGHLGFRCNTPDESEEYRTLVRLTRILDESPSAINDDGRHNLYPQSTPKGRICAALRAAIEAGK